MLALYLLRHATADPVPPSLDHFERPLSQPGLAAALLAGTHMQNLGFRTALVICSGARRARETLAAVRPCLSDPAFSVSPRPYLSHPVILILLLRPLVHEFFRSARPLSPASRHGRSGSAGDRRFRTAAQPARSRRSVAGRDTYEEYGIPARARHLRRRAAGARDDGGGAPLSRRSGVQRGTQPLPCRYGHPAAPPAAGGDRKGDDDRAQSGPGAARDRPRGRRAADRTGAAAAGLPDRRLRRDPLLGATLGGCRTGRRPLGPLRRSAPGRRRALTLQPTRPSTASPGTSRRRATGSGR